MDNENLISAKRNIENVQRKINQNGATLELLDYAFKAIQAKEPVSFDRMPHDELSSLAMEYSDFIYRVSEAIAGVVDVCYSSDTNLGSAISSFEEMFEQQKRLYQLQKVLQKRLTPEESQTEVSNDGITKFIINQDSLLMATEELLNGEYDEFDKDIETISKAQEQASQWR